jgi:GntR family transcriptional regulator
LSYTRAVPAPQRHRGPVGNGGPLDRSSFVPLYYQLQEVLKEQIESGYWHPDELLPSEPELARRFGVSRAVVRQALDILEDDHQIVRIRGRGTFVARPKLEMPLQLVSFSEDMLARGLHPGAIDITRRTVRATVLLARAFRTEPGTEIHVIERLRTADGEPMAVERAHILASFAPDLLDRRLADRSLYGVLEAVYGLVFDAGDQIINAGVADATDARHLKIPRGSAVLLLERRSYAGGVCAELTASTYRADRYQLHTTLEIPRRGRNVVSGPLTGGPPPDRPSR